VSERVICAGKIIITPLLSAVERFYEAVDQAENQLERDGTIQRFEFVYELLWKTLKKILQFKGIEANNPRDVFREAAKNGLMSDPEFWFEVLRKRNLTTHIYKQDLADEIFDFLPQFKTALVRVMQTIEKL
jgi:nucleotidyltransferase substrate binding protein (TIGR01987 family)